MTPKSNPAAPQVSTWTDPTVARRRLGIKLRELREAQPLRLEDAAARLGLAPSTLSRIETGKAPTRHCYLASMLNMYGINDPELRQALVDLAREGMQKAWWTAHSDLLPDGAGRYFGMEAAAGLIRSYSTQTVPALLQTADYAAAACQVARPGLTGDQTRRLVAITKRRQKLVNDTGGSLHVIIDESALARRIAPAAIMAAQLDHLRTSAARPSVTVHIAPLAAPIPVLSPSFAVLSFTDPSDADVAITYGPGSHVTISTDGSDVQVMLTTFTTLAKAALSPTDSLRMINNAACQFR